MSSIVEHIFEGKLTKKEILDQVEAKTGRRPSERTWQRWKANGLLSESVGRIETFSIANVRRFFAGKPSLPAPRPRGRPKKRKEAAHAAP